MRDRIYIDLSNKGVVESIEQYNYFNFKHNSRKEQFMFAVAAGVNSGLQGIPLEKRFEWFWVRDFKDGDLSLIKAAAVYKTKDPEILRDIEKVFLIAEEYANLGFRVLKDKIDGSSFDTFEKEFEALLIKAIGND